MLGEALSADPGYRGPRVDCGSGHEAVFTGYRDKVIDTVLGPVALRRAWYHCAHCEQGLAPRDAELGVAGQSMSPGLAAMTAKAGAAVPFTRAAGLLEDLAGVRLTVKRVERAAEASGAALAAASRTAAALVARRKLAPLPPTPLPDKLYAIIDGTGVPVTSKETAGRDGKGEDGRARTREVKMAVFFTQDKLDQDGWPVRDRASSSYIATFEPAAAFADLVKAEGIRRGADHVRQFTVIGDGAAWIWNLAAAKFPEATCIVDLYHAREHLHSLTRSLEFMLGDRKDEWLAARLEDLDYGYIDGITAAVRELPPRRRQEGRGGEGTRLLPEQRAPHALPLVPPVRPVRRLRRRRGRLQGRHRPAPQAVRHALDRQRRRRHHHLALRPGQQPVGSHLQQPSQPDRSRSRTFIPVGMSVHHGSMPRHAAPGEAGPAAGERDPLEGFSAVTRDWFTAAFATPTQAQTQAWAAISKGENTLVIAPTGSGKTLSAFLWALDRLAAAPAPEDPKQRCRVLYISPLKALAVDIERNLRAPLTGIRHTAQAMGAPEPDIRVAVRTGDTAAEERRRLAASPPDILITTPESLFLLLTSKARDALRGVDTVIVDEVHALAGNKRGAHLALSLETAGRAHRRTAARPSGSACRPRSARLRDVASFLGGARPVTIAAPPSTKQLDVSIVVPVEDMTDLDQPAGAGRRPGRPGRPPVDLAARRGAGARPDRAAPLHDRVRQLAPAGRAALRPAQRAGRRARRAPRGPPRPASPPGQRSAHRPARPRRSWPRPGSAGGAPAEVARAHHGSVSRQERAQIEEALKAGRLPAVVATSSLELGIDMGAVDLVIQVESPPSVASGLQRTGRAGHNVGDVSRGVIFPKYQGDLVQAAVVARRMRGGQIEQLAHPPQPAGRARPADRRDDRAR